MFPSGLVASNPLIFIGTSWIQVSELQKFIAEQGNTKDNCYVVTTSPPSDAPRLSTLSVIKWEVYPIKIITPPHYWDCRGGFKSELKNVVIDLSSSPPKQQTICTCISTSTDMDLEVIELLSSDDKDMPLSSEVEGLGGGLKSGTGHRVSKVGKVGSSVAPTDWLDSHIHSYVEVKQIRVTRQVNVEHVEYLSKIPSVWPVPQVVTTYVLDLWDPKFHVVIGGKILMPDTLIKNKVCTLSSCYILSVTLYYYKTRIPGLGPLVQEIWPLLYTICLVQLKSFAIDLASHAEGALHILKLIWALLM